MTRQFHKFFNLIFGGFVTFGTTVPHHAAAAAAWSITPIVLAYS
jgi:hypothetical protein